MADIKNNITDVNNRLYCSTKDERPLRLFVKDSQVVHSTEWRVGDKIRAPFRGEGLYSGYISEILQDGLYKVEFDDGDETTTTSDAFVRDTKMSIQPPLLCEEGSLIKCTHPQTIEFPITSLFDFKHGVMGGAKDDWRAKFPKKSKTPCNILISFQKPYMITRIRLYWPVNKKNSSKYTLNIVPSINENCSLWEKPVVLGNNITQNPDSELPFQTFNVNMSVNMILIELTPSSNNTGEFVSMGAIDLFHKSTNAWSIPKNGLSLVKSLSELFRHKSFADCRVYYRQDKEDKKGTENFVFCHRNILYARSSYFRNKMRSLVKEEENNKKYIDILLTDVNCADVTKILKYLYTGCFKCKDIEESVRIWEISEKYMFDGLREKMNTYLCKHMNPHSAIKICLEHEEMLFHEKFMETLVFFLSENIDSAMDVEEFVDVNKKVLRAVFKQTQARKILPGLDMWT